MAAVMSTQKKPLKIASLKANITKELNFLKGIFSVLVLPSQNSGEYDADGYEMVKGKGPQEHDTTEVPKRAHSIAELEERLEKIKSQSNFNLKTKLMKKSLSSKLNKKIKKQGRVTKTHVKPTVDMSSTTTVKKEKKVGATPNAAKPVFNTDGKLVFSKFDFANIGQNVYRTEKTKTEKNPKKILENMEKQKAKFRELEERQEDEKVREIREKEAWKNILQKAEGQKIKDDPILLKKSVKKMDQKKKLSKKQWDNRITIVQQKKDERQKKRQENISKKKKEKKSKVVKAAVKRGRVVI